VARFAFVSGSETFDDAWTPVLDRLRESGHSGCVHGLDQIAWEQGVAAGVQALADRIGGPENGGEGTGGEETILVGHSLAGLLLPSLGERLGAAAQVYIAALVPHPGHSVFDQLLLGEEIFAGSWSEGYAAMRQSADPLTSHRSFLEWHLFHDCPAHAVERYWLKTDLPLREIYETRHPAPNAMEELRFIVCTGDRTLHPSAQRPGSEQLPGAIVAEIATGHCPHLAAPVELADLLLSLTGNAPR
jgi:hypothetical protein